jgi:hypothetical protein
LERELTNVLSGERALAAQQFRVHHGEAVLVRVLTDLVLERFRGRVQRRDAAHQPARTAPLQLLHEAEVRDLHPLRHHEQVARLHVQVLQVVLLDQVVETDGGVVEEPDEHVARDARAPGRLVLFEHLVQVAVGQLHHDDEFAAHVLNLLDGHHERVPHLLDAVERFEFLNGARVVAVERVQVPVHELDGLVDAAGRDALPHFAEPAGADRFDQPVAGERFGVGFSEPVHTT